MLNNTNETRLTGTKVVAAPAAHEVRRPVLEMLLAGAVAVPAAILVSRDPRRVLPLVAAACVAVTLFGWAVGTLRRRREAPLAAPLGAAPAPEAPHPVAASAPASAPTPERKELSGLERYVLRIARRQGLGKAAAIYRDGSLAQTGHSISRRRARAKVLGLLRDGRVPDRLPSPHEPCDMPLAPS
jgi:hypothetical protein